MRKVNLKNLLMVCIFVMTFTGPIVARTIYVDPNGSADFNSIQAAIDDANDDDEIEVAPGTYPEAINFNGKAVRLYSSGGPKVTTIDANGLNSSVVTCSSSEDSDTILEGFTITGGYDDIGGGMHNSSSSPTVTSCIFSGNTASDMGGGMLNYASGSPMVTNCTFSGNSARSGGGMCNQGPSPTVVNCIFNGNSAMGGGGMFNDMEANPIVINCTFAGNSAVESYGGGICNDWECYPILVNCILWGNSGEQIKNFNSSSPNITYSDIQGGWTGVGNIDADPCFVDTDNPDPNLWDLRLKADSPCIDAGNTTVSSIPVDADGNPRGVNDPKTLDTGIGVAGVIVDMGAYEFQPCRIDGDINCDGKVDFEDLAVFCNNWLEGTEP